MAKVVVEFTADEARLVKAQQKLIAQEAKIRAGYEKIGKAATKASTAATRGQQRATASTNKGVASIKNLAASYFSAQAALMLFNQALAEKNRLESEAKDVALTVGQSQAAVIKNLGLNATKEDIQKFLSRVKGVQGESGFESVAPLNKAASDILSAVAGDRDLTIDILKTSAAFFKDAPDDLAAFGGSLGDILKVAKGDAEGALALALSIQGQSRFTTLGGFKSVAPALAAGATVTEGGLSGARESAAVFASFGNIAGDADGSLTKTGTIGLEQQLAKFVPEANTTFERLEIVWKKGNKELVDKITSAGFRGATKAVARNLLLDRDSAPAERMRQAHGQIKSDPEAVRMMRDALLTATPELRSVSRVTAARGTVESAALGRQDEGVVAEIVNTTLDQVNFRLGMIDAFRPMNDFIGRSVLKTQSSMVHGSTAEGGMRVLTNAIIPIARGRDAREQNAIANQNSMLISQINILRRIAENTGGEAEGSRAKLQAEQRQTSLAVE